MSVAAGGKRNFSSSPCVVEIKKTLSCDRSHVCCCDWRCPTCPPHMTLDEELTRRWSTLGRVVLLENLQQSPFKVPLITTTLPPAASTSLTMQHQDQDQDQDPRSE